MQRKVSITETVLRDGQQSLMATRMKLSDILPIVEVMNKAGYHSLECWGGATFDSCIRFLNEDPWKRLRIIKEKAPDVPLQMLLRGQNLVGYRHYADDIVDLFVKKAVENGIDIFRIFDALNDTRNITSALKAVKKYGAHAQLAICYTISEVHTVDYFTNLAKELFELGADSICIKDMSGILTPNVATQMIGEIKKVVAIPVAVHTHSTSGISQMTYLAAVEAGADIIDCAISPFAEGTSQPATESLRIILRELGFNVDLDVKALKQIASHFKVIRDKYLESGELDALMMFVDPETLLYQVPGGMLSNLLAQLKESGAENKFEEVLLEIAKVRADLGYPPLVTPMSQMVGTQAVFNVLTNERYKVVPNEVKDYLRGKYGKSPIDISASFRKTIVEDSEVVSGRPADYLKPEIEELTKELGDLARCEEDLLTYALFPQIGREFLEQKYAANPPSQGIDQKNGVTRIFARYKN